MPDARTALQLMEPCQCETSIPSTVAAEALGTMATTPASRVAAGSSHRRNRIRPARLCRGLGLGMGVGVLPSGCGPNRPSFILLAVHLQLRPIEGPHIGRTAS